MTFSTVFKCFAATAILMFTITVCVVAQYTNLANFEKIYPIAVKLESVEEQKLPDRINLLARFASVPKSLVVDEHYYRLKSLIEEYRGIAFDWMRKQTEGKTWFDALGEGFGSMWRKVIHNSDPARLELIKNLETKYKDGLLSEKYIEEQLAKYEVANIENILFALKTDIKYLIIEDRPVLNTAIYGQLKRDKYLALNNFHNIHEIDERQRQSLLIIYQSYVDTSKVTIEEAAEHVSDPGNLIIGRLMDSCENLQIYKLRWSESVKLCGNECSADENDSQQEIDEFVSFCDLFLPHDKASF